MKCVAQTGPLRSLNTFSSRRTMLSDGTQALLRLLSCLAHFSRILFSGLLLIS